MRPGRSVRSLPRVVGAALLALGVLLPVPTALRAQAIGGSVALAGWGEPVAGATVQLMDSTLMAVATTTTDPGGRFAFLDVPLGTYQVQAEYEGQFTAVAGPVALTAETAYMAVTLTLPSPLLDRARRCFGPDRDPAPDSGRDTGPVPEPDPTAGVLAGVVHDPGSGIPLPAARVVVQWDEAAGRRSLDAVADGAGRFAVCGVPGDEPLSVWVQAMGTNRATGADVMVEPGAIARLDLAVALEELGAVRVVRSTGGAAAEGAVGDEAGARVQGTVVDAGTGTPVAVAVVAFPELARQTVTDDRGRFVLTGIPAGTHALEVQRLGYDLAPEPVEVPAAAAVELEVRVSPQVLDLEPVVVRTYSDGQMAMRASPHSVRAVSGRPLREHATRGAPMEQVMREIPGLQITPSGWMSAGSGRSYGPCVQSSRRVFSFGGPACQMVEVIFNGVSISPEYAPAFLYGLQTSTLESIEYVPPLAAARYGFRASANGALVIWSRGRGPHAGEGGASSDSGR